MEKGRTEGFMTNNIGARCRDTVPSTRIDVAESFYLIRAIRYEGVKKKIDVFEVLVISMIISSRGTKATLVGKCIAR